MWYVFRHKFNFSDVIIKQFWILLFEPELNKQKQNKQKLKQEALSEPPVSVSFQEKINTPMLLQKSSDWNSANKYKS